MNDKMKVFKDLDMLVKMCRSKSDGASLQIEEEEIKSKIEELDLEINEIKANSEQDIYDSGAEMADRNIEIILKKVIQTLKLELKAKNNELTKLKAEESKLNTTINLLKDNKKSYENYIASMQERINGSNDSEVISRYTSLIKETEEKVSIVEEELAKESESYSKLQDEITSLTEETESLEDRITKKQEQLAETQHNLENKEFYIDNSKKEKTDRKIAELEAKKQKLIDRLEEIKEDPKYLESKTKEVLNNNEDPFEARPYLIKLINKALEQPYMDVPADNALEEELLRATQMRDSFANEIDQKEYNLMNTINPEQIRIDYLNKRIENWNQELEQLKEKISVIDKDEQYNYQEKESKLTELITTIREELAEYEKAYEAVPESNLSSKASLKLAVDEKREDLIEAEKIAALFREDEANDVKDASRMLKIDIEELNKNIEKATEEIENIKNRLMSKKSGLTDIGAQNKDKQKLKELADVVINIKHRRQFVEQPITIAERLEEILKVQLVSDKDFTISEEKPVEEVVESTTAEETPNNEVETVENKIEDTVVEESETPVVEETAEEIKEEPTAVDLNEIAVDNTKKRGVKVLNEVDITPTDEQTEIKSEAINNISEVAAEPETQEVQNDSMAKELDAYINSLNTPAA